MKTLDKKAIRKLLKPWQDLAGKNENRVVELYGKDGKKLGIIEQGKDGFTEIIVSGPHFGFTKVWLYPPANAKGWVKASGLLCKK